MCGVVAGLGLAGHVSYLAMTSPRRRGKVSRVRRSFKSSTAYLSSRELRDGRRPDGEDTLEHRPARSTGAHARSTRSLMSVFSSSAKRHVAPVMLAMKAGVGRVSLDHRASTEGDATLFGLCGHPGGRESVDDGDGAPRSTRRADNRILALSTWLARNHRVTSASKNPLFVLGAPGKWRTRATGPCVGRDSARIGPRRKYRK